MPDPTLLPYRPDVLEFLRSQKQAGRRLILATGSDRRMADAVAAHLGIFDDVLASDGHIKSQKNERPPRTVELLAPLRQDLSEWRLRQGRPSPALLPPLLLSCCLVQFWAVAAGRIYWRPRYLLPVAAASFWFCR